MSPADAIALPFIERDFETPSYDRKLALDRIRTREYKARRKKQMKRLTGYAVGDATRRPHYIHGPGVKADSEREVEKWIGIKYIGYASSSSQP